MRLSEWSLLEQTDIIEAEKRDLLIDFGKETVRVMSNAKDPSKAMALIEHLRRIYFVEAEEQDQQNTREQVDELIRLAQLTYRVEPRKGGALLTIGE